MHISPQLRQPADEGLNDLVVAGDASTPPLVGASSEANAQADHDHSTKGHKWKHSECAVASRNRNLNIRAVRKLEACTVASA
eukprot:CAMPEP_0203884914 /NCGR_PEP_ID=MMETSP0359-20131031/28925_1 /ASSEMBLY_ACC=CAM_ASM_000338 /TAXON_ID=268821 /ORGANISM="Scrippsiella Hangoei, Strain SHTV-5" /LENGTH=81 /DNA_ID=CAMNT_0050805451 /DNA_START=1 /DNA_END=247 /DNA_ORIENTATION=-